MPRPDYPAAYLRDETRCGDCPNAADRRSHVAIRAEVVVECDGANAAPEGMCERRLNGHDVCSIQHWAPGLEAACCHSWVRVVERASAQDMVSDHCHSDWPEAPCPCPYRTRFSYPCRSLAANPYLSGHERSLYRPVRKMHALPAGSSCLCLCWPVDR